MDELKLKHIKFTFNDGEVCSLFVPHLNRLFLGNLLTSHNRIRIIEMAADAWAFSTILVTH